MTAPRPTVTSLEIMPVYGQSENRPRNDAPAIAAALDGATAEQVYYTYGMIDTQGALAGVSGAGWAAAVVLACLAAQGQQRFHLRAGTVHQHDADA